MESPIGPNTKAIPKSLLGSFQKVRRVFHCPLFFFHSFFFTLTFLPASLSAQAMTTAGSSNQLTDADRLMRLQHDFRSPESGSDGSDDDADADAGDQGAARAARSSGRRAAADSRAPRRFLTSFLVFYAEQRPCLARDHPELPRAGVLWKFLVPCGVCVSIVV
jgi:hypothetical protein